MFTHPLAGKQLVKGTIEPGETPAQAAVRELAEEAGVTASGEGVTLGSDHSIDEGQVWHFVLLACDGLPDRWTHQTEDDGGHLFACSWHALADPMGPDWHSIFPRAMARVKELLAERRALEP